MSNLMLFTDGSVNTKSKIGYGAFLIVSNTELSLSLLEPQVKVKKFENTSSTKLELQTLLWAIDSIEKNHNALIIYTDSQNIIKLPSRRRRLEKNDYYSNNNRRLNNYKLYQKFYNITDLVNCNFVKVNGHKVSNKKDSIDKIFTLVDKASRKALRRENRGI